MKVRSCMFLYNKTRLIIAYLSPVGAIRSSGKTIELLFISSNQEPGANFI
jgi:hypothetical protein